MRMIRVNQCCCGCTLGCTLQTGTKIIAWIHLLIVVFSIGWEFMMIFKNEDGNSSIVGSLGTICGLAICIAITIPLLIVAHRNSRPKLLLPWLILNVIGLLLAPLKFFSETGTIYIVIFLLGFALDIYCWLVIYSYRQQLLEIERRPNSANQIPMLEANK